MTALLSHWWRNPLQLFTLMAGLALATALWSGVQAVNAEARASYDAAAATLGEGTFDRITLRGGAAMSQADYVDLRRAGWLVSPVVEGRLNGVRLIGIDPLTAPAGVGPVTVDESADLATFLSGAGQIFANQTTLDAIGDLQNVEKVQVGDVAPNVAYTDIGIAQRLLDQVGQVSFVIVHPDQPVGRPTLAQVSSDLVVRTAENGTDVSKLTDSFHLNLTAFGFLSFAVGIFIVNGAIGLAFEQRRSVVRTLRSLGMPLRTLIFLIVFELLLLAIVAGVIGVAIGYLVAGLLLPDVAATLRGLYGADVSGALQLRASWWLSGLAIAVGGTMLAGGSALWQLARLPLLAQGQPRALAMAAGRRAWWQAAIAAILLGLSAILAFTATGLVAGFALLAALLIGAALALPVILSQVLTFGENASKGMITKWFWADTRQQLNGLSLALMALLLAMSANVGVSTMVSSFRLTFVGFLDQRLASELYVYTDDTAAAEALVDYVTPRVDAILPIQSAQVTVSGVPTDVFGARDHPTYSDNWTFVAIQEMPWKKVARGEAILINEQLARRGAVSLGDQVSIAGQSFEVAGIYGDYGNPIGQALINEQPFTRLFPDAAALRFGLRMPSDEVGDLRDDLARDLGLPDANMINQAGIKAYSLDVFDRTFTVTTALNILTLSVAGFAILMSLLTLATMRLPQLAPAWATGMTRRHLATLELVRAVLLASLTAVVALPLGLGLAWVLLAIVNVAAFGWELPMYFFPADYARLGMFALIAAALAAVIPAIRLSRTPPAVLLKVFSNER
ncbi:ABC transporter permease [Yoonia sp. 208BN28-4]|uniref:ABC transporter permease n=1 Tax=Yoonia sp. 208BN28-4 TaxID=3126505 RepID=UPI0030AB22EE